MTAPFTPTGLQGPWRRFVFVALYELFAIAAASVLFVLIGQQPGASGAMAVVASKNVPAPGPGAGAYSAAKAAVIGMTKSVAADFIKHKIRCNAICPGYVWTPLVEKQIPDTAKARGITEEQVVRDVMLSHQARKEFVQVDELAVVPAGEGAADDAAPPARAEEHLPAVHRRLEVEREGHRVVPRQHRPAPRASDTNPRHESSR